MAQSFKNRQKSSNKSEIKATSKNKEKQTVKGKYQAIPRLRDSGAEKSKTEEVELLEEKESEKLKYNIEFPIEQLEEVDNEDVDEIENDEISNKPNIFDFEKSKLKNNKYTFGEIFKDIGGKYNYEYYGNEVSINYSSKSLEAKLIFNKYNKLENILIKLCEILNNNNLLFSKLISYAYFGFDENTERAYYSKLSNNAFIRFINGRKYSLKEFIDQELNILRNNYINYIVAELKASSRKCNILKITKEICYKFNMEYSDKIRKHIIKKGDNYEWQ